MPSTRLPAGGQNHIDDPSQGGVKELSDSDVFKSLPLSFSIFRIYARNHDHDAELNKALNEVLGDVADAKTNM